MEFFNQLNVFASFLKKQMYYEKATLSEKEAYVKHCQEEVEARREERDLSERDAVFKFYTDTTWRKDATTELV